jgi:hypothetical protein
MSGMRRPTLVVASFVIVSFLVAACGSSSSGTNVGACPAGFVCTPQDSGGGTGDGVEFDTTDVDSDAGSSDSAGADADTALDAVGPDSAGDIHYWQAPDAQRGSTTTPAGSKLYAHSKDTLYVLNPETNAFDLVGMFTFNKNAGLVTDIALNKAGSLFAVTYTDLFQCTTATAKCSWLAQLPQEFNGLTFIPAGLIDANDEVLVGIAGKGTWYRIDFGAAGAKLTALGSYGGGWWSSGDAFSVVGVGTYATLKKCNDCANYLAEIDPATGKVKKVIGKTGTAKWLFGLAWFKGIFYAVSQDGKVYMLDIKTAAPTAVQDVKVPKGVQWWGAGISTHAGFLTGG